MRVGQSRSNDGDQIILELKTEGAKHILMTLMTSTSTEENCEVHIEQYIYNSVTCKNISPQIFVTIAIRKICHVVSL